MCIELEWVEIEKNKERSGPIKIRTGINSGDLLLFPLLLLAETLNGILLN